MQHLITNANYLFLLKKGFFKLYDLKTSFAIHFTKLKNFNKNIKENFIIFIYYNLL